MQCLKYGHIIAQLGQIAGAGQSCRTGADYRYFLALFLCRSLGLYAIGTGPVSHKAFQLADGYRLAFDTADAFALTLALLRTHTAADCRQGAGLGDNLISPCKILLFHLMDKSRDIDGYRASLDAHCIFTIQASARLCYCLFFIISQADFFKIGRPHLCVLLSDRNFFHYVCFHSFFLSS